MKFRIPRKKKKKFRNKLKSMIRLHVSFVHMALAAGHARNLQIMSEPKPENVSMESWKTIKTRQLNSNVRKTYLSALKATMS